MRTKSLDREGNRTPIIYHYTDRAIMIPGIKFLDNKIPGIILFAVQVLVSNAQTFSGSFHSPGKV